VKNEVRSKKKVLILKNVEKMRYFRYFFKMFKKKPICFAF